MLVVPELALYHKMLLTHRTVAMVPGGGHSVLFLTPSSGLLSCCWQNLQPSSLDPVSEDTPIPNRLRPGRQRGVEFSEPRRLLWYMTQDTQRNYFLMLSGCKDFSFPETTVRRTREKYPSHTEFKIKQLFSRNNSRVHIKLISASRN